MVDCVASYRFASSAYFHLHTSTNSLPFQFTSQIFPLPHDSYYSPTKKVLFSTLLFYSIAAIFQYEAGKLEKRDWLSTLSASISSPMSLPVPPRSLTFEKEVRRSSSLTVWEMTQMSTWKVRDSKRNRIRSFSPSIRKCFHLRKVRNETQNLYSLFASKYFLLFSISNPILKASRFCFRFHAAEESKILSMELFNHSRFASGMQSWPK